MSAPGTWVEHDGTPMQVVKAAASMRFDASGNVRPVTRYELVDPTHPDTHVYVDAVNGAVRPCEAPDGYQAPEQAPAPPQAPFYTSGRPW